MTRQQELWLQALESDEFSQGKHYLQTGNTFCCLGVGCVVAEREGIPVKRDNHQSVAGSVLSGQKPVKNWLGLRADDGSSLTASEINSLTHLNDNGKTFKEIAAIIRANPEEYFTPEESNDTPTGTLVASPGVG